MWITIENLYMKISDVKYCHDEQLNCDDDYCGCCKVMFVLAKCQGSVVYPELELCSRSDRNGGVS